MSPFLIYSLAFLIGGNTYCLIELIYRARTHYSMFFCAGIAVSMLLFIYLQNRSMPSVLFALIAALVITVLELIFGAVFNIWLNMGVWDYSQVPLNLFGQICLPFSAIWFGFGLALYYIFKLIKI